jgi:predicted transposase/invertase (TIGR01784 family)
MGKLAVRPKIDLAFKKLFSENDELLKSLICAALDIKSEDIQDLKLENTEVLPQDLKDKFCRLDLKIKMKGRVIDIEIQLNNQGNFQNRALYYWARLFSQALATSEDYSSLPETIVISFIDFDLFGSSDYHSQFGLLEKERLEVLTDKFAIHFFELTKIPKDIDKNNNIELWLKLIGAETDEDLTELENVKSSEIKSALNQVKKFNADDKFKSQVELREQTLIEERSALNYAKQEGEKQKAIQIARNLLDVLDVGTIAKKTGLSVEEIEKLKAGK